MALAAYLSSDDPAALSGLPDRFGNREYGEFSTSRTRRGCNEVRSSRGRNELSRKHSRPCNAGFGKDIGWFRTDWYGSFCCLVLTPSPLGRADAHSRNNHLRGGHKRSGASAT